jgi:hypothetical protein
MPGDRFLGRRAAWAKAAVRVCWWIPAKVRKPVG